MYSVINTNIYSQRTFILKTMKATLVILMLSANCLLVGKLRVVCLVCVSLLVPFPCLVSFVVSTALEFTQVFKCIAGRR